MISYLIQTSYYWRIIIFLCYSFLIFIIKPTHSQYIYQSLSVVSGQGTAFLPANIPAQWISETFVNSWKLCAAACHMNPFCRVFDYDSMQLNQCLLFEGDIGVLGSIVPSSMPDSIVGIIQITPNLFTQYGQSCSSDCVESRYLICSNNSICECLPHFYWDASGRMCLSQMTISGAPCDPTMNMCREDLNLTCSAANQCIDFSASSPSGLIGTIIADGTTVIEGSSSIGLQYPWGITVYEDNDGESLIVIDTFKNEVIHLCNIDSSNKNVSVLASNWTGGDSLSYPSYLFLDTNNQNDLYVADSENQRVVLFSSMQIIDPPPQVVAGIKGVSGPELNRFVIPYGVAVDSQSNLYVADNYNHRIMLWALNASSGVMIAGTGTIGNDSMELNYPAGLFLDEYTSSLYVVDSQNHRIQLFILNGTPPYNGTTVAGGNGAGSGSDQFDKPLDVWVSSKTGAIYIADTNNGRIQRWSPGATSGDTIVGGRNDNPDVTSLITPVGLTINKNETRLYVSDAGIPRIIRFDLI